MAMLTEARQLVEKVATGNRILAKSGLADAIRISVGHVSARIPNTDLIILKGRGYPVPSPRGTTTRSKSASSRLRRVGIYVPPAIRLHELPPALEVPARVLLAHELGEHRVAQPFHWLLVA